MACWCKRCLVIFWWLVHKGLFVWELGGVKTGLVQKLASWCKSRCGVKAFCVKTSMCTNCLGSALVWVNIPWCNAWFVDVSSDISFSSLYRTVRCRNMDAKTNWCNNRLSWAIILALYRLKEEDKKNVLLLQTTLMAGNYLPCTILEPARLIQTKQNAFQKNQSTHSQRTRYRPRHFNPTQSQASGLYLLKSRYRFLTERHLGEAFLQPWGDHPSMKWWNRSTEKGSVQTRTEACSLCCILMDNRVLMSVWQQSHLGHMQLNQLIAVLFVA